VPPTPPMSRSMRRLSSEVRFPRVCHVDTWVLLRLSNTIGSVFVSFVVAPRPPLAPCTQEHRPPAQGVASSGPRPMPVCAGSRARGARWCALGNPDTNVRATQTSRARRSACGRRLFAPTCTTIQIDPMTESRVVCGPQRELRCGLSLSRGCAGSRARGTRWCALGNPDTSVRARVLERVWMVVGWSSVPFASPAKSGLRAPLPSGGNPCRRFVS
jgi:hypothetical protein